MFQRFLRPANIPNDCRANCRHLYLDMAWFGVLSGSAVNFLNIYAARLGASGTQIGLLSATGAAVSLLIAIPAGRWLEKRPINKAVFWTSALYRFGFLTWIFLPWLLDNQGQVWALIAINLLMGIPLTALSVGFSALFAEAIPPDLRAHVTGVRNILLSITYMLTSLISGWLLDRFPFPLGYQIVFAIGFAGAAMSSFHLYFVKPLSNPELPAAPTPLRSAPATPSTTTFRGWRAALRLDIWSTHFGRILLLFLAFHLAQQLALPVFPLYVVNKMRLNDVEIGIGNAVFYLSVLVGSTQLNYLVRRLSHHKVTGLGVAGLSLYPILMSISSRAWQYYGLSAIGGLVWALVSGAYLNYILESTPANDRPAYLAWYNVVANACILAGSLAGPLIADQTGLSTALILFGVLRLLAGLTILKWG
jgi:MFS family permease